MTILTDDLIEKAARAINALVCADAIEQGCTADGIWDSLHEPVKAELLEEARAALEAALPALRQAILDEQNYPWTRLELVDGKILRSLLNKEDENG